jgi:hypothetical protein
LVQPLNKGCIKNLVAVMSPNLDVALGDLNNRLMAVRTLPGEVKGFVSLPAGRPGRTRRPQVGSPHDSLARSVHVLFAQESRAQV